MAKKKQYWLIKSEPDVYGIEDLERDGKTPWDGVRNYQSRNTMRDDMKKGDLAFYYHSGTKTPGIVGVARVASDAYADPTQFDENGKYFDPKATEEEPRWQLVDFEFVARFDEILPLQDLKDDPKLEGMPLLQRGQRLSVQPVDPKHFKHICKRAGWEEIK